LGLLANLVLWWFQDAWKFRKLFIRCWKSKFGGVIEVSYFLHLEIPLGGYPLQDKAYSIFTICIIFLVIFMIVLVEKKHIHSMFNFLVESCMLTFITYKKALVAKLSM
jgi:hypothetical protein